MSTCECGQPLADYHEAFTRGLCHDCYGNSEFFKPATLEQILTAKAGRRHELRHGGKPCDCVFVSVSADR